MSIDITRDELQAYVEGKLKAVDELLNRKMTDLTLDAADILLNDIVRVYRFHGVANNSDKYKAAAAHVAHARIAYNKFYRPQSKP